MEKLNHFGKKVGASIALFKNERESHEENMALRRSSPIPVDPIFSNASNALEFSTLFEVSPSALFLIDWPSGRYLNVNEEWSRQLGYSRDEVMGRTSKEIGLYADIKQRKTLFSDIKKEKKVRNRELTLITKSGKICIISAGLNFIRSKGKNFLLGSFENITKRRQAELALKASEENLIFTLASARMGTWEIDLKSNEVSCSRGMLELWSVSEKELRGNRKILQKKVHLKDLKRMQLAIEEAIQNRSIYECEYRIHPKPGVERWVVSRGRCTYDNDFNQPSRFSGVVYDITERKVREEKLAEAIRARDQFLSIASHELKTPLTGLQLQMQIRLRDLKRDYPAAFTPEKIKKDIHEQYQYIRRITQLIDDVLDVARTSEGRLSLHLETFNLREMVTDVIRRFRAMADNLGVKLLFDSKQTVTGRWDRFRLEQVLLNLLTNALRYGNKKPIRIQLRKEGKFAIISVQDQGIGIRKQDQSRIFEKFERAISKNEISGLGLGLYISKEIVQTHGGEIRLKSAFGKGALFEVLIPIV